MINHSSASHSLSNSSALTGSRASSFEILALGQIVQTSDGSFQNRKWYDQLLSLPAYYWVLIAQVIVVLPHAAHLPLWLMGFAIISISAQLPSIKAKFRRIKQLKRVYQSMQMLGFLLGLVGLWLTYNAAFGLDMGVAFLILCLISKLWELYKRRDAYVVLNLSLLVLAALFLMDQGLMATLEVIVGTAIVLLAFIALNDDGNLHGEGRLRSLGVLGIGAIPLLVVLFLFFPRLPPLWSVQLSGQQATTGVSDSMSPGDFASLGQSTELAFRVQFANNRPPQEQLYWRGLVFSDFDGVTWRPGPTGQLWQTTLPRPPWVESAFATIPDNHKSTPMSYEVILEPTQQRWLFGLDYPLTQSRYISLTTNFTLVKSEPVTQQLRYDVLRFAPMAIDTTLDDSERQLNLALPSSGNPQARALAKQLFLQSGSDPIRYIQALEKWISQTEFRYTLSPPRLNNNRIDEFLFKTKAGFCEHYSSSFTFMLRAAGIPARVVTGYQGGALSRGGNVWEVRQMDAHAWTEVWLDEQGWVRVDPTSFVAPERVEQGMDALAQTQGATLFGDGTGAQISYQQYQMLQSLRRLSDQASYYWQKDIVGYDQDKQAGSLLKWLNISSMAQQIAWLVTSAIMVLSILVLTIWLRRRKRLHPVDLPLMRLSKRLSKQDPALAIHDDEDPLVWLDRVSCIFTLSYDSTIVNNALTDQNSHHINEIKQSYRQLRYGRLSTLNTQHVEYRQTLQQLKKKVRLLR